MIRFETVVKGLVFVLVFSLNLVFAAEPSVMGRSDTGELRDLFKEMCQSDKNKNDDCNRIWERIIGGSTQDCGKLTDDYNKSRSAFKGACGAIPKAAGAKSGEDACAYTLARCDRCVGKPSASENSNFKCGGGKFDSMLADMATLSQNAGLATSLGDNAADVFRERQKLTSCPALAPVDLDKMREDTNKQRDEAKKERDKLPELVEKRNKAMNNMNEKLANLREKMSKSHAEFNTKMRDSAKRMDEALKMNKDQFSALTAEVSKAKDGVTQEDLSQIDASVKLKQTKIQIDLNCHASASQQVAKMQGDIMGRTGGNLVSNWVRGGFMKMLNFIGISDRQAWQKVANTYYQWCLQSTPTIEQKKGADDAYQSVLTRSAKAQASIREKITNLQQQQSDLLRQTPCGVTEVNGNGSVMDETQQCKIVRNAQQDQASMDEDRKNQENADNITYQLINQQGTTEVNDLSAQIEQKKADIQTEGARVSNMQTMLSLRNQAAGGTSVSQRDFTEARTKYSEYLGNAGVFFNKCCKSRGDTPEGTCREAQDLLRLVMDDSEYDNRPVPAGNTNNPNTNIPIGATPPATNRNPATGAATPPSPAATPAVGQTPAVP